MLNIFRQACRLSKEYLVMVAIVFLVLITMVLEPKFISIQNLTNVMSQLGALSLVSLGMTFVIIAGFVDLSVAGIINLVAVVTISLIEPLGQLPALVIGLSLGAFMGWVNSILILASGATTQAEALFVTFGMSTVYGALALIFSGGSTQQMRWITSDTSIFQAIGSRAIWVFSIPVIIFMACLAALYIFQSKTYIGRAISLTGANKTAAYLSGVPVNTSIMLVFTISGAMAALGSIVLFSRVTSASPVIGMNYETNAILSVVVGGTTLKGGNGGVLRTLFGVILVTLLSNCMNLLGISTYIQTVLSGAILMVAIWLDNRKDLRRV